MGKKLQGHMKPASQANKFLNVLLLIIKHNEIIMANVLECSSLISLFGQKGVVVVNPSKQWLLFTGAG